MNVTNIIHITHNVKLSINRLVPGSPPMTPGAQGGGGGVVTMAASLCLAFKLQ